MIQHASFTSVSNCTQRFTSFYAITILTNQIVIGDRYETLLIAVKNSNILFIPRLNSSNNRTNDNGVDLNRNFPTKNWELTAKNEYFGGNSPASEKETRFIIDTIEKYDLKLILSIHAPYKIVNYDGPYNEIIEKIASIINYPIEPSIGYPTPGSFGTWAGIEKNILTITLELDEEIEIEKLEKPMNEIFNLLESY